MPSFPASREMAAIGGIVANNAGGEKTLSYGKTLDYVDEVKVILFDGKEYTFGPLTLKQLDRKLTLDSAEGQVYRKIYTLIEANFNDIHSARPKVTKNSSGYYLWDVWDKKTFNLAKLFTGSQGTLGIITEVRLRLIRPLPYSRLLVIFLKKSDTGKLSEIVNHILQFNPETFESYDDHTLKLAVKFIPQFIKRLRGNIFTLGIKFIPELKMMLTGGFPKFVLTAEFTGESQKQVLEKVKHAHDSLKRFHLKTHITHDDAEAGKYKLIRR